MNWSVMICAVIIILLVLIILGNRLYVVGETRSAKKHKLMTKNEAIVEAMNHILENPGKEMEPWMKDFVGTLPKFTFPIQGICGDGELVEDVLKRLGKEGNQEKLSYFRKYMNLDS